MTEILTERHSPCKGLSDKSSTPVHFLAGNVSAPEAIGVYPNETHAKALAELYNLDRLTEKAAPGWWFAHYREYVPSTETAGFRSENQRAQRAQVLCSSPILPRFLSSRGKPVHLTFGLGQDDVKDL